MQRTAAWTTGKFLRLDAVQQHSANARPSEYYFDYDSAVQQPPAKLIPPNVSNGTREFLRACFHRTNLSRKPLTRANLMNSLSSISNILDLPNRIMPAHYGPSQHKGWQDE